jgi:hypothetical protein
MQKEIPYVHVVSYRFKIPSAPSHSTLHARLCYLRQDLGISILRTMFL